MIKLTAPRIEAHLPVMPVRGIGAATVVLFAMVWVADRMEAKSMTAHHKKVSLARYNLANQILPPIDIRLDAQQHAADSPDSLKRISELIEAASGAKPEAVPDATSPDWLTWSRLNKSALAISTATVSTEAKPNSDIYAAASDEGGAVFFTNPSHSKRAYSVHIKLPRGVYRIERLCFSSGTSPTAAPSEPTAPQAACATLRRLEGADIAESRVVTKSGEMDPTSIVIIRFTDVARIARAAFSELDDRLHEMALSTPGPAARIKKILNSGSGYSDCVQGGEPRSKSGRLARIHHLLLLNAQARSLQHNFIARQTVNAAPGEGVMSALDTTAEELSETSAVLIGVVPQIDLSQSKLAKVAVGDVETTATVSVSNTGDRTVEAVKLGMDASALPQGATCTPDDPAYFGALRPGQSVRAEFAIHVPAGLKVKSANFAADISYFTSGAPAHLKSRPWTPPAAH